MRIDQELRGVQRMVRDETGLRVIVNCRGCAVVVQRLQSVPPALPVVTFCIASCTVHRGCSIATLTAACRGNASAPRARCVGRGLQPGQRQSMHYGTRPPQEVRAHQVEATCIKYSFRGIRHAIRALHHTRCAHKQLA